jgi:RecG-like helicase
MERRAARSRRRDAGLRARDRRADAAGRDGNVIVDGHTREWTFKRHPHLSVSQHRAVEDVLESRDKMMALEGVAGAGKTTSLAAVRDAVVHHGYEVKGLAPTSRAAQKLAEAGMETETLQRHLARGSSRASNRMGAAQECTSWTRRAWSARGRCTRSWSG